MAALRKVEYGVPTEKCANTVRLGIEKGIFEEEGIDLSIRIVFGGPELVEAYNGGALAIGEMGSPPVINAIAAGGRFRIVGGGCRQKAHMFLAVRPDIDTYADLAGRRIGLLGLGSCPHWMLKRILGQEGLDPERDVEYVPLLDRYPRVMDLIADGTIDACLAAEPAISIGESRGVVRCWTAAYGERYLPRYQWDVRVAQADLIEHEPETVHAIQRGCRRSAHYAATHVDEWAAFGAGWFKTDEAAMRAAIARELPHYELDCRVDMGGLQHAVDLQARLGGIPGPMRAEDFVDARFLPAGGAPVSAGPNA